MADVLQTCRPEKGVRNGVGKHVGIGVAEEASIGGDLDPPEYEPATILRRGEGVDVDTEPNPHQGMASRAPSRTASMASANTRSSGEVNLMLVFSPSTISTRPPSRSTREASSVAARRNSSGKS